MHELGKGAVIVDDPNKALGGQSSSIVPPTGSESEADKAAREAQEKEAADKAAADAAAAADANAGKTPEQIAKEKADADAKAAADAAAAAAAAADAPKFDDKGNQINDKGEIIKTVEQINEEEDLAVFEEFTSGIGFEIKNPDGTPKVYEPTLEGMRQYAIDSVQLAEQIAIQKLYTSIPGVERYVNHRINGGTDLDFVKPTEDVLSIDLAKMDAVQKKDLFVKLQQRNGVDEESAKRIAGYSETANNIDKDVKALLDVAQAIEKQRVEKDENDKKAAILAAQKEAQEHFTALRTLVTNGKLSYKIGDKEVTGEIPVADREAFFEFITKPIKNNLAAIDLAIESMPEAQKLWYDYHVYFKRFDFNDVVTAKVKNERIRSLRDLADKSKQGTGAKPGAHIPSQAPANASLGDPNAALNAMFGGQ